VTAAAALGTLRAMTQGFDSAQARERLEHERERVSNLITSLRGEGLDEEESAQTGELTHYDQHPADQASETFEREKDLAILEQLEAELAEIEAALARIDEGTYGLDEVTGRPIDPERLEAYPTARTNIDPSRR
jgi:RNA polymerase-binding transcription factor DksA